MKQKKEQEALIELKAKEMAEAKKKADMEKQKVVQS